MDGSSFTQLGLFGKEEPAFDTTFARIERLDLGEGAWLEFARAFLAGHDVLMRALLERTLFHSSERRMYDRDVVVPRVTASLPEDGPGHPVIASLQSALSRRYATWFARVSLAYYRDGRDSVAWHGDYVARRLPTALVASVSLGAPRRFLVRSKRGGRSHALTLGWGDLLVMGGTCQRTHEHAIPKVAHAEPRMAVMFRPVWRDPDSPEGSDGASGA